MSAALTHEHPLASARYWLGTTRIDRGNVILVRKRLREAGATPEDIGTTEEHLCALERAAQQTEVLEAEIAVVAEAVKSNGDKVIALAKRIVAEGLTEVPAHQLTDGHALLDRLEHARRDAEVVGVDVQAVVGNLEDEISDDDDGDTILEKAVEVVKLTNHAFAWAREEPVPEGETFEPEDVEGDWKAIVDELKAAGSGLADLGLDDECLSRLKQVAALRPVPDPPAEEPPPAPEATVIDLQTRRHLS